MISKNWLDDGRVNYATKVNIIDDHMFVLDSIGWSDDGEMEWFYFYSRFQCFFKKFLTMDNLAFKNRWMCYLDILIQCSLIEIL
jgi:hypothetical protein